MLSLSIEKRRRWRWRIFHTYFWLRGDGREAQVEQDEEEDNRRAQRGGEGWVT
jgi:hypothetical protein